MWFYKCVEVIGKILKEGETLGYWDHVDISISCDFCLVFFISVLTNMFYGELMSLLRLYFHFSTLIVEIDSDKLDFSHGALKIRALLISLLLIKRRYSQKSLVPILTSYF